MHIRRLILLTLLLAACLSAVQGQTLIPDGERLLVWVAPGTEPGRQPASDSGSLSFLNADGSQDVVLSLPPRTAHVVPCGDDPTSPDGRQFAFYVGGDRGDIYMMTGTQTQLQLIHTDINAMTCTGAPTFTFSPDSARFAYMDYADTFNLDVSPSGRLHIRSASTYATLATLTDVAAFDLNNQSVALVRFFYNSERQGIEAELALWDGSSTQAIAAVTAENRCYYTSASVEMLGDGRIVVIMGHRCPAGDGRTRWQFYLADTSTRAMALTTTDVSPGRYFAPALTNRIYSHSATDAVYFTVPDGLANYTVNINALRLGSQSAVPVVNGQALMPIVSIKPYVRNNHPAVLSPDGRWLALVRNDPNNNARLTLLELTAPDLPPIELSAGERSALVDELLFSPDSQHLYYVTTGAGAALYHVDLALGAEVRVRRGSFGRGVISPSGAALALTAYEAFSARETYQKLVLYDLSTQAEAVLFTGADIVDNKITNQRFIYPLAWRRS